jgi:hypothetical protein
LFLRTPVIRPDGSGDVTQTHIVWRDKKGAPYFPSLIVAGDFLPSINNANVAFCYEAVTGNVLGQEKLGWHHASPVLVGRRVVFINDNGEVNVIKPVPDSKRVAKHELCEPCFASPAISDGQIFLRGLRHLYCIGIKTGL